MIFVVGGVLFVSIYIVFLWNWWLFVVFVFLGMIILVIVIIVYIVCIVQNICKIFGCYLIDEVVVILLESL